MGTWGPEPFDNDEAADWADELDESENPLSFVLATLRAARTAHEDLDTDQRAVAAAALVASLPPTSIPIDSTYGPQEATDLSSTKQLRRAARLALTAVLSADSTWSQLWNEAGSVEARVVAANLLESLTESDNIANTPHASPRGGIKESPAVTRSATKRMGQVQISDLRPGAWLRVPVKDGRAICLISQASPGPRRSFVFVAHFFLPSLADTVHQCIDELKTRPPSLYALVVVFRESELRRWLLIGTDNNSVDLVPRIPVFRDGDSVVTPDPENISGEPLRIDVPWSRSLPPYFSRTEDVESALAEIDREHRNRK